MVRAAGMVASDLLAFGKQVGIGCVLDRLAEYAEQLRALAEAEPLKAGPALTQLVRTLAILNGIVLSVFATLIIWHGLKGRRTASMPPRGSWILEGQRTWTGESALRIAQFTIVVGAILAVLGVASSLALWRFGETFTDQALKQSAELER